MRWNVEWLERRTREIPDAAVHGNSKMHRVVGIPSNRPGPSRWEVLVYSSAIVTTLLSFAIQWGSPVLTWTLYNPTLSSGVTILLLPPTTLGRNGCNVVTPMCPCKRYLQRESTNKLVLSSFSVRYHLYNAQVTNLRKSPRGENLNCMDPGIIERPPS